MDINNTKQKWNEHWASDRTIEREKKVKSAYPEVVKTLLGLTNEQSNCIELGCGSGIYAIELLNNKRKCIASDFSENALKLTKIKGKELYNLDVLTQLVDVYKIPYPENSFDLVFSDGVIEHLDITKVFREMKRVVKPGGLMVAKVPSNSLLYRAVYYLLSPIEHRSYEVWLSKKEWQNKLNNCGYKNIDISYCGGILIGLAMRIGFINKFLNYIPQWGKIYFLIKARK